MLVGKDVSHTSLRWTFTCCVLCLVTIENIVVWNKTSARRLCNIFYILYLEHTSNFGFVIVVTVILWMNITRVIPNYATTSKRGIVNNGIVPKLYTSAANVHGNYSTTITTSLITFARIVLEYAVADTYQTAVGIHSDNTTVHFRCVILK